MPDIDHFSDSEASFHSFSDDEPSPPPADPSSTQQHPTQGQDHDRQSRRRNRSPKPQVPETTSAESTTGAAAKIERFSPEEEATLLAESNSLKGSANQLFGKGSFENAIQTYDRALSSCPNYLDFEVAVLRSNVAACHLKLEEWKEAVESATKGVECLDRLEPLPVLKLAKTGREKAQGGGDEAEEEGRDDLVEEVDDAVADRIENLQKSGKTLDEVRKLQIKLLLRRARAKSSLNTWAELQGADEDYRVLMSPVMLPSLSPIDRKQVLESARKLAPRLNEAKDREMAEMMGKLKGVGNSVLGMFGLSTDNFQFVKDEKSGGYSMNFNQNPGK